jgi:hypothetical protein
MKGWQQAGTLLAIHPAVSEPILFFFFFLQFRVFLVISPSRF